MNIFRKKITPREMGTVLNSCFNHCVNSLIKTPIHYSDILDVSNEKLCDEFLTEMYALLFFEVRVFINKRFAKYKYTIWNSFSQNGKRGELFARYSIYAKCWNDALKKQKESGKSAINPEYAVSQLLVKRVLKKENSAAVEKVEQLFFAFEKVLKKKMGMYRMITK